MLQQEVHKTPTCFGMVLTEETKKVNPNMDWNTSILRTVTPFVSHPADTQTQTQTASSFTSFLRNPNYHPLPGLEANQESPLEMMIPPLMERNMMMSSCYGNQEKKRRLTVDQLESLESSFQEDIKLDPDRKMKLARELGLQPRQVAVWFQNRRARWRAKKLEHLYDVLKHEYEVVIMEKQKLHQEVLRLKSMLIEQVHAQGTRMQVSGSHNNTEASCDETVESIQSYNSNKVQAHNSERETRSGTTAGGGGGASPLHVLHGYDLVSPSYWGGFPSVAYPSK